MDCIYKNQIITFIWQLYEKSIYVIKCIKNAFWFSFIAWGFINDECSFSVNNDLLKKKPGSVLWKHLFKKSTGKHFQSSLFRKLSREKGQKDFTTEDFYEVVNFFNFSERFLCQSPLNICACKNQLKRP